MLRVKELISTTRPRYGKIGFMFEVDCDITPTLQCICGLNEEPDVLEAIKSMIAGGRGYILSVNTFATFSTEWARPVLIVEKAETKLYHGVEGAAHCAAVIGSPGEHREERTSLLVRHGNPNVDRDLENQLRYHWFCEEETNKHTDLPREEGETTLHVAVRTGNVEDIWRLLDMGESVESFDSAGMTPLHTAAARGGGEVLKLLAQKSPSLEVQCLDYTKDTPLVLAARRGKPSSIDVLLDNGANIEERNGIDYTPLMSAAYECHADAVETLLKRGADPNSRDEARFSGSPLLLASGRNDLGVKTLKLLVAYGADVNPTFHKLSWTPLLKASDTGNDSEVEFLLGVGANPNVQDFSRRTPLIHAVGHAREKSVRMFLDAGADREAVDNRGLMPVHLAASCGNYKIMEMLLGNSMDVNVKTAEGNTAMHLAVLKGQATVVKMLLGKGAAVNAEIRGVTHLWISLSRPLIQSCKQSCKFLEVNVQVSIVAILGRV